VAFRPIALPTSWLLSLLIGCVGITWLGWGVYVTQHRKALIEEIKASGGGVSIRGSVEVLPSADVPRVILAPKKVVRPASRPSRMPLIRGLCGDRRVWSILFPRQLTDADKRAIEWFPEAEVTAIAEAESDHESGVSTIKPATRAASSPAQ